jgi:hypothetical protein
VKIIKNEKGFSIIEVVLAAAIFVTFATAAVVAIISGLNANRLGTEVAIANQFNAEGMEAVRSIKNQAFATVAGKAGLGNQGVVVSGGVWTFSGTSNSLASDTRFVRTIVVTSTQRDASGNIVVSGTVDPNTYKVVTTTTWNFNTARQNSVVLTEYMTNWKSKKGGLLVYGNGGTTTDAVQYRVFDASANTWGTATAGFDVDGATTNKALRTVRVYSSKTRNEKIAITRHYNGTAQFIYATVWNGSSWGTPTQLSTWTAATFLDVLNFDGAYLNDGTFMAIYSDNTNIPKYRIWNGTSWAAQSSMTALPASHTPVYIMASARSGSNEVMTAIFTNGAGTVTAGNTITEYWSGAAWSATTIHASASITNTKRFIDFDWSPNTPTTGILIYTDSTTDKTMTVRLCTASGGVCTWGTAVNSGTAQTNNMGALNVEPRPNSNEFQACDKDAAATPTIVCFKVTFVGSVPTISAPVIIAAATDTGIQRSFDIDWEAVTGEPMVAVYSDNTAVPKFKKFTATTTTWDAAATSITTTGAPGVFKTIRMIPQDQGDDMIVLLSDANLDIYSILWNGSGNAMYTTPAGKAYTAHGTNGSATADYWFDFTWDKF